ncbi:MAG: hypothetical protein RL136_1861 [Planctomycetota bacterium]|jgi:hypothetical protein
MLATMTPPFSALRSLVASALVASGLLAGASAASADAPPTGGEKAPAKPATPPASPKKAPPAPPVEIEISAPDAPPGTARPTAGPKPKDPGFLLTIPPRVINEDAAKIAARAKEEVAKLKSLELVTQTTMENVPEGQALPDLGIARRVQLRWIHSDAVSMPLMRITDVFPAENGFTDGESLVFDGRKVLFLETSTKRFREPAGRWMDSIGTRFTAMPRWYVTERSKALMPKDAKIDRSLEPVVVGARILRTETFDGVECDVVELFRSQDVVEFADNGQMNVVDTIEFIERGHFARTDGLPRQIELVMLTGSTPGATTLMKYLQVRANPEFDNALFSTKPPEDFVPAE